MRRSHETTGDVSQARLEAVGKLAAGVAHELGTPLNVVSARAKIIASGQVSGEEAAENARIIAEQAARMAAIIRQLLDFARRHPPERTLHDVGELAREALAPLTSMADSRGVALKLPQIIGRELHLAREPRRDGEGGETFGFDGVRIGDESLVHRYRVLETFWRRCVGIEPRQPAKINKHRVPDFAFCRWLEIAVMLEIKAQGRVSARLGGAVREDVRGVIERGLVG